MDHFHDVENSSNILGCGMVQGKLEVAFHKNGVFTGRYRYNTNEPLCCKMVLAESKGQFFSRYIKHLSFTKLA